MVAEVCHHEAVNKQTVGVAVLGCQNAGSLVDRLGFVSLTDLETICAVLVAERFESQRKRQKSRDI